MTNNFYAHIRKEGKKVFYQTVREHNEGTAGYASAALSAVGLDTSGYLAGLLHDMGKYTEKYQEYLQKAVFEENAVRGSVNHTFAPVCYILEHYHDAEVWGDYAPLTAELLAYAVGAHHGLFDCVDGDCHSGFLHRLNKEDIGYEEAVAGFGKEYAENPVLDMLFQKSMQEIEDLSKKLVELLPDGESAASDASFYVGILARLLLSAVMEGDRRDTAEFMDPGRKTMQSSVQNDVGLWEKLAERVNEKIDAMPVDSELNLARRRISEICRDFGTKKSGIYRLHVPTGAGKTLSSLRYALSHAAYWGKSRIIFTSPLLSILDQNAAVIRSYIDDDSLILEHHSNVVQEEDCEETLNQQLLSESWEAPIIITTMVQLLNTMFDGRGSCVRKFHSLCDSVIVVDEVQTVPVHLLSLFNLMTGFLSRVCKATLVLCSATQPCTEAATHPIPVNVSDMVPYDAKLWNVFKRTELHYAGERRLEEVPEFIMERLDDENSLLVICNKKSEAEYLYRQAELPGIRKFYLSASMIMAHRRKMLSALQETLRQQHAGGTKEKVLCISTQVIEAGVDISFARVIRLMAGMESIVQSAGRCNRNGESVMPVQIDIVKVSDEDLKLLPDIQRGKKASAELFCEFEKNPDSFHGELMSDAAVEYYYRSLYREMPEGLQDGIVKAEGRNTTLLNLLSENDDFTDCAVDPNTEVYCLHQAFKTAGKNFTVFDEDTTDVLVPYREGREIIADLSSLKLPEDFLKMKELLRKGRAYSVSLYGWQRRRLEKAGGLVSLCEGSVLALQEGYYDEEMGVTMKKQSMDFLDI